MEVEAAAGQEVPERAAKETGAPGWAAAEERAAKETDSAAEGWVEKEEVERGCKWMGRARVGRVVEGREAGGQSRGRRCCKTVTPRSWRRRSRT